MDTNFLGMVNSILNGDQSPSQRAKNLLAVSSSENLFNQKVALLVEDLCKEAVLPIAPSMPISVFSLTNADENVYHALSELLRTSQNSYFKATCGEILWWHTHNKEYANIALKAYEQELSEPTYQSNLAFTRIALSICRIYSKYKPTRFPFDSFFEKCLHYIESNLNEQATFCLLHVLQGLLACCKEKTESKAKIEQTAISAAEYLCNNQNYRLGIALKKFLQSFYRSEKRSSDEQKIIEEIALEYEREAQYLPQDSSAHVARAIATYQDAMNTWSQLSNRVKGTQERKRLARTLEPLKAKRMGMMLTIKSEPVDLSETIKELKQKIQKSTFEEFLYFFTALLNLESPEILLKEIEKSSPLASLFSSQTLDSKGRVINKIPSILDASDDEKKSICEHKASEKYLLATNMFATRCLAIAREKWEFTEENLRFLVEDNLFVPEDRKESFLKGLVARFRGELGLSMCLLMPQVENAIRVLASNCGAVVYKTDSNGVEEVLSLDSILQQPEIKESVEEKILFNVRVFYTGKNGFNMRNNVCHGLYSDAELQSIQSLAAWWFTLYLCCHFCPELYRRIEEQSKREEK